VEPEDLLKFGLIPNSWALARDRDARGSRRGGAEEKSSPSRRTRSLSNIKRLFEMENTDLSFQDEALKRRRQKAIERRTGARGYARSMEGILLDTMFELPGLDGVEQVVIGPEVRRRQGAAALYLTQNARKRSAERRELAPRLHVSPRPPYVGLGGRRLP